MSQKLIQLPSPKKGIHRSIKDMHSRPLQYEIVDEILLRETGLENEKCLSLQRIRWETGEFALRLGYYMYTIRKSTKTKYWAWGQYCTFVLEKDWKKLEREAKQRGWM